MTRKSIFSREGLVAAGPCPPFCTAPRHPSSQMSSDHPASSSSTQARDEITVPGSTTNVNRPHAAAPPRPTPMRLTPADFYSTSSPPAAVRLNHISTTAPGRPKERTYYNSSDPQEIEGAAQCVIGMLSSSRPSDPARVTPRTENG